jgi:hypothetical protein
MAARPCTALQNSNLAVEDLPIFPLLRQGLPKLLQRSKEYCLQNSM